MRLVSSLANSIGSIILTRNGFVLQLCLGLTWGIRWQNSHGTAFYIIIGCQNQNYSR